MKRLLTIAAVVCLSLGFSLNAWAQHACTATVEANASDFTFTIPCAVVGSSAEGVHDTLGLEFKLNNVAPFQILDFSEPVGNTTGANAAAPVPKTGCTYSTSTPIVVAPPKEDAQLDVAVDPGLAIDPGPALAVAHDRADGDLKRGATWPNPRFTDNGDGTVTDHLTGLIWLKNADCTEFYDGDGVGENKRSWSDALTAANNLAAGYCGLQDGSSAGYWRLPNLRELISLAHFGFTGLALPDTVGTGQWTDGDPFSDVDSSSYWSSTTYMGNTDYAWAFSYQVGHTYNYDKTSTRQVWPVRGGL